jgi:hypothetical protein
VNFSGDYESIKEAINEAGNELYVSADKAGNPFGEYKSFWSRLMSLKHKGYLLLGCALIIGALITFISSYNYFANVLSGPRSLTPEYLENELSSGNIKDINIEFPLADSEVYQAGYTGITKTVNQDTNQVESETTDSEYYITIVGKHLLVIEGTPNQLPSGNFYGVVLPLRADLEQKLASDFSSDPDLKNLASSILPYMVSNQGMTSVDTFGLIIFGIVILLLGAYILFRNLKNQI